MIQSLKDFKQPFFIGIAGAGMSAIAQYLHQSGKNVSGSDRFFKKNETNDIREKLEQEGIACFEQTGEGITDATDLVVVSTAIEDTVIEVVRAKKKNIPILKRSELLSIIVSENKTIAIGGTSGKSTTSAMLYDILKEAGMEPSIISGAGLISIIKQGKIGNAKKGNGEWLIIEADESDGSIVQYHPAIGVLLNVDKDHQEMDELQRLFAQFKNNSSYFITNLDDQKAAIHSQNPDNDFAIKNESAGWIGADFKQKGFEISFAINDTPFKIALAGKHNMENALAAVSVAGYLGVNLSTASVALEKYEGIYRRSQVLGQKKGVWVVDDFAHNPVKCAAAIRSCQPVAKKVIAWLQPHGYGPTRFLRNDFVYEISGALRPEDEIWMSEIFYAGGTAVKNISANDLINDLKQKGASAFFVEDRNLLLGNIRSHFTDDCVLLLMGARDPSLEYFAKEVWESLSLINMLTAEEKKFMERAVALSLQGMEAKDGGPFGCVVVKDGKIIGEGNNRVTKDNDPTAHAEVVAIRNACKAIGHYQLEGCEIYTSCEPCPMCLGAIYWARPGRVVFANTRQEAAAIDFDDEFIYTEAALPLQQRSIPFYHEPSDEAKEVFKKWDEWAGKKQY